MEQDNLQEGGVAGHMNHLYDNGDLTFGKMKEIFNAASEGKLIGTEKTDGQNLMISYSIVDGRAKGVRNKGEIKAGGLTPEQLAAKFADRGNPFLKETFTDALSIFEKAVQTLDRKTQEFLFGPDTSIYYNAEVMDPRTPNVIQYDTKTLVIHRVGHIKIDRATGQKVEMDLSRQTAKLESVILAAQERLAKEEYSVQINAVKSLKALDNKKALHSAVAGLNKVLSDTNGLSNGKSSLSDNSTIDEYMLAKTYIQVSALLNNVKPQIGEVSKLAEMNIIKRIIFGTSVPLTSIYSSLTPKQVEFVKTSILDKETVSRILKTSIEPVETIVSDFATEMLGGLNSAFILDNSKEVKRLQAEVQAAINAIEASGNDSAITMLKYQMNKLKSAERVTAAAEGFVFDYDGVTYKFTGSFAPINQLLGLFKYGRGDVKPMQKVTEAKTAVSGVKRVICVYPGRFQPMSIHHVAAFRQLQKKFGEENTFIATSNLGGDPAEYPKSPLSFEEKKAIMLLQDIPSKQIALVKSPYAPVEIYSKFDQDTTAIVFAVGAKDMAENPRFKETKNGKILKEPVNVKELEPLSSRKYYLTTIPHQNPVVNVKDDNGKSVKLNISSGTQVREILSRGDKNLFKAIMGFYQKGWQDLLMMKFRAAQQNNIKENKLYDIIRNIVKENKNPYFLLG